MQMIDLNEARPILYDETLHSKASSINTNDTIVLHNDATQGTVHILIDFEKKFREVHDREFDTSTDSLQSRRPSSFELELVFDYDTIEKLFNTDPESLIEWVQASLRSSSVFLLRLLHTLEPTFMSNMHRAQRDPVEMTLLRHGEKESDQTVTVDIMPQIPFAETLEERLDEKITQLNASSSSSSSSSTVSETVNAPSGAPQIPLSLQLEAIRN